MDFKWATGYNNGSYNSGANAINRTKNEQQIVLALEMHNKLMVGGCGKNRHDIIYPIGFSTTYEKFVSDAQEIVKKYAIDEDIYMFEYFYGYPSDSERGSGKSLYKIEFKNGDWHFYQNEKYIGLFSGDI